MSSLATMICSSIYEGTAPRYAPEGSQPTSKPVAPNQVSHASIPHTPAVHRTPEYPAHECATARLQRLSSVPCKPLFPHKNVTCFRHLCKQLLAPSLRRPPHAVTCAAPCELRWASSASAPCAALAPPIAVESGRLNTQTNASIALQVKMTDVLALAAGYQLVRNSKPPAGVGGSATLTTLNLVYELKNPIESTESQTREGSCRDASTRAVPAGRPLANIA